jgi:MinD-like ATPase involved in chromosome partitioning or flagellar assembly
VSPHPVLLLLGPTPWEGPFVAGLAHPSSRVAIERRCLDTADLLACAESGLGRVAVVGADAPRVDADVVARLRGLGVAVVAVVGSGDDEAYALMRRWGAAAVVTVDREELGAAVRMVAHAVAQVVHDAAEEGSTYAVDPPRLEPDGRLVAVWGPTGAPGRTSVAVAVADEAARRGCSVLLVDADTWGASVTVTLGMVDDGAGLASACRRALAGTLDVASLVGLAREIRPGFTVLPGLPRAGRWTEVRSAAMVALLEIARHCADLVVVDCGFSLERDEELVFDTDAPRRNAATFASLEAADVVLAVGTADPVGLVRLVAGLVELDDVVPGADRRVVVTRVRESMVGRRGDAAVAEALHRHAGVDLVTCVPDDRPAYDAALRSGRTLAEVAPTSPARYALRGLAAELVRPMGIERRPTVGAGTG